MPAPETTSPAGRLRVLVVDDERLARQRLVTLLNREPDVDVVGTASSGSEAIEKILAFRDEGSPVDVVLLDVQMPGATGLDVIRQVGPEAMPATIFVTAYDQHALAAFELAAIDYLLKPFENERFRQTLQRARETVRLRKLDALHDRLRALLEGKAAAPPPPSEQPPSRFLERIAVEMRGQVRVLPVEKVDYCTVEGNYVRIHAGDETFFINDTMGALEERLDPARFFRIHRSTIVQLDRIDALLTAPGGDYAVRLHDGTRLNVARARRDALAERLGIEG